VVDAAAVVPYGGPDLVGRDGPAHHLGGLCQLVDDLRVAVHVDALLEQVLRVQHRNVDVDTTRRLVSFVAR
jgi:hypothetical protein